MAGGSELSTWRRAAFGELMMWLESPPAPRAVLLSGARRTGKTTLLLQAVQRLLERGVAPTRIVYITLDHPVLRLAGLRRITAAIEEMMTVAHADRFLIVDEIHHDREWVEWVKHQVDFQRRTRIAMSGSAMTITSASKETGVGRWHTIRLPTLSFCEYLRIRREPEPDIPRVRSLADVFDWTPGERTLAASIADILTPRFHEYLLRGGFPQTALVGSIRMAQQLLREDIVDGALRRDMSTLYQVRNTHDLERVFLYICMHDGAILDMRKLTESLEVNKDTARNYIRVLESVHLIYLLPPTGYGKQVLRGQHKAYLSDAAIAGAVMMKGESLLDDTTRLGSAVETAVFKHLFTHYHSQGLLFSYWRGAGVGREVDIVAQAGEDLIPFKVKYRSGFKDRPSMQDTGGLAEFCKTQKVSRGYVLTRDLLDFGVVHTPTSGGTAKILRIPAMLACYLLSRRELESGTM